MDKLVAVLTLITECRRERVSFASANKQIKCLKAIGLDGDDLNTALCYLDIISYDTGKPYLEGIKI